LHPNTYLSLHGAGGVGLVFLLVWVFGAIADEIPENAWMVRLDEQAIQWLQTHGGETGESVFFAVSWLGAQVLVVAAVSVTLFYAIRGDWLRAIAVAVTIAGSALLNYLLKAQFHRGRPEFATEFITHQTWSFPSGHAMESLVGYGFFAYLLLERTRSMAARRAIVTVTVVLVGLIGFSRLYLGVHYPSDVIGGYIAGAIWLVVCITGYRHALAHIGRTNESGFESLGGGEGAS
jgi:undecaprenyl-diphosphatase